MTVAPVRAAYTLTGRHSTHMCNRHVCEHCLSGSLLATKHAWCHMFCFVGTHLVFVSTPLQVLLMGAVESYRANGAGPGVEGLDKLYPGEGRLAEVVAVLLASLSGNCATQAVARVADTPRAIQTFTAWLLQIAAACYRVERCL